MASISKLQSNILSLANTESDTNILPYFFIILTQCPKDAQSLRIIQAGDRLIGYLFSYGKEFITIGEEYYQAYMEDYPRYVIFNWQSREARSFCEGCHMQEWECKARPFSSECTRFQIAWAVEHVVGATNLLLQQLQVKRGKKHE